MPSNLIIFDADYVSELTSSMRTACDLMGDAVSSLKKARAHEGWKCKECERIVANIDDLNTKLGRLDAGVNETTRVLGRNISNYADLEAKYENQANSMSEEFRENYGYTATVNNNFGASEAGSELGAGAGVGAAAAGSNIPTGKPQPHHAENISNPQRPGNVNIRMPAGNININMGNNSGMPTGGTVNLPVTYIPDRPDPNIKCEKVAVEVADVTVDTVADTITNILGGKIKIVGADGTDITSQRLIEVFNAGKDIVDNSASIVSHPQGSHAQEHLAMAAGLMSLAGTAVTGLGMLGKAAASSAPSIGQAAQLDIKDMGKNAENLLTSVKDNSSAGELGSVLGAISAAGAASSGDNNYSGDSKSSSLSSLLEGNETINNFVENILGMKMGGGSSGGSSVGSSGINSSSNSGSMFSAASSGSGISAGTSSGKSGQQYLDQILDSLLQKLVGNKNSSSASSSSSISTVEEFLTSFVR